MEIWCLRFAASGDLYTSGFWWMWFSNFVTSGLWTLNYCSLRGVGVCVLLRGYSTYLGHGCLLMSQCNGAGALWWTLLTVNRNGFLGRLNWYSTYLKEAETLQNCRIASLTKCVCGAFECGVYNLAHDTHTHNTQPHTLLAQLSGWYRVLVQRSGDNGHFGIEQECVRLSTSWSVTT